MSGEEKIYWLGLKLSPALRNRIYILAEKAGGPKELWRAGVKELMEMGLTEDKARAAIAFRASCNLDAAYGALEKHGITMITTGDDAYPNLLKEAHGHPEAVFVKGEVRPYSAAVAVVGARKATSQGNAMAEELAAELAKAGVVVVSGAARGIDTAAHKGALAAGGETYAVLGCGPDIVYPPENKRLFAEIAAHGALISEFPPGTAPLPRHFPTRNRIVAGMVSAVVVVEAGDKSGALITADFALDYGREVLAVPGFCKNTTSRGTNKLIKQGAYLVESAEDILEVLGIAPVHQPQVDTLTDHERLFLDALGWESRRVDEIVRETNENIASTATLLLTLEMAGFIKRDIAGSYIRVR